MTVGAFSNVATQSYAAGNQIVPINIYAKCNIPVCFEGTSAAIGSISGAIYVFLIGNVAAGANDGIAQLSCRVIHRRMIVPYLLIIIFIIKLTFTLTSFASQIKFLVRDPSPEGERERER